MLDFTGRVAIITGSSLGMGRAYAEMLAERGCKVVVNGRRKEKVDIAVSEIREKGGIAVPDYSDVATDGAALVKTAIDNFGKLDIVINNAGIVRFGFMAEQDPKDFWDVFNVSFKATLEVTRAAWPYLLESDAARVILTSSSGFLCNPGITAYGSAKGAIWGLGNTLQEEGIRVGIQVSTIVPTAYTPMTAGAYTDPDIVETMQTKMGPEHVAAFVTYLCHPDTKIYGKTWEVSSGHARRLQMVALPKVKVPESTPETWVNYAAETLEESTDFRVLTETGEVFVDDVISADPKMAAYFENMNPNETNPAEKILM